ncbi:MAG: carbohydrate-binding domain-containing protein [Fibromonadales bacterium]|nr:carbohydrate-binding domain-containing protein [Fibromonadales bacterium]
MRLKLLFLLLFIAFFVSCSGDSDPDPVPEPDSSSSGNNTEGSSSSNNNNTESSSSNDTENNSSSGNNAGSSSSNNAENSSSGGNNAGSSSSNNAENSSSSGNSGPPSDLGLSNAIVIRFNGNSDPTIINPNEGEVRFTKNGGNVSVTVASTSTTEYNLVVSGATTGGSLKVYGEHRIAIHLNGVNITNPNGPAINIQNGKRIGIYLVGQNYLADGAGYPSTIDGEDAKGTLFSEGQLVFFGSGTLEIKAKNRHAIVSDDYLTIESGNIKVAEAAGDGIHVNDDIIIKGGKIDITSVGDAIQSERLNVKIFGGQVTAKTSDIKSHGIVSFKNITVNDSLASINIDISVSGDGSKGMNSTGYTEIKGGTVNIKTSGGRNTNEAGDESNAAGIKTDLDFYLEGGSLTIKSTGSKSRGIRTNGSMFMTAGVLDIEADDDGIKVDKKLEVSGGSGSVKSKNSTAIDCPSGSTCNKGSLTTNNGGGGL